MAKSNLSKDNLYVEIVEELNSLSKMVKRYDKLLWAIGRL